MMKVSHRQLSGQFPADHRLDDRLVRIALQRWFTRVCEDPVLQQDNEMRSFVESDFGVSFLLAFPFPR